MTEKITFFDWCEEKEKGLGEEHDTIWIKDYAKHSAWENYKTGTAIHSGDCTNCPYTCDLCALTDLLIGYRDYFFAKDKV